MAGKLVAGELVTGELVAGRLDNVKTWGNVDEKMKKKKNNG